ncbi:MAG: ribonuclease HI family protein [Desulfitobacteriaceae bacterium]|nr:ribonuclease HI family protein [Desulfitobacteriaceae bacterium]
MWKGYFDGASKGNPGEAAIGAYLVSQNGAVAWEVSERIGLETNNGAEYAALIALLEEANRRGLKNLVVFGDSQLVVNQVNGNWRINYPRLQVFCEQARRLMAGKNIKLKWIPREQNARADRLTNEAFNRNDEKKTFDPTRLEKVAEHIFIAHETEDYAVDLLHNACTCPAFKSNSGGCRHLEAARVLASGGDGDLGET